MIRIDFNNINGSAIEGEIELPSSKSITNRAFLIKKISNLIFNIYNPSASSDSENLRINIELIGKSYSFDKPQIIDICDAGTNMRFLTALLSITPGIWIIKGNERMNHRPMKDLVDALRSLGAEIDYIGSEGYPPLSIKGRNFNGGEILLNSYVSSQFISALLLIAPSLKNGLKIKFTNKIVSHSYVDMTLRVMEYFGINFQKGRDYIFVDEQNYLNKDLEIEADWSSASYWYEIAALSNFSNIKLNGLKRSNFQGDTVVAEIFEKFGVVTTYENEGIILSKKVRDFKRNDIELNCNDFPDLVPAIAFTAAGIGISIELTGINHLIFKESNRIEAIANEIRRLGVKCIYDSDKIKIIGSEINFDKEVIFKTYDDHRLAMSIAPLALKFKTVKIDNGKVVSKSYPNFWVDIKRVGFSVT